MTFVRDFFRAQCGGRLPALLPLAAVALALGLGGCAQTSAPDQPAAATPGVTVYGTVDAGVSRSRR